MADNVDITPGSGATIAADEVTIDGALAKVQRVKPVWGVAGSAVDASATNPMPIADATVAARLAGATPHPAAAGTGDIALTNVAGRLMSFSCAETTGSAGAKFYLRDGTDSTGTIVAIVTLAAGESVRDSFGPNGITLATGLWLDRVSGTTEVTAAVV